MPRKKFPIFDFCGVCRSGWHTTEECPNSPANQPKLSPRPRRKDLPSLVRMVTERSCVGIHYMVVAEYEGPTEAYVVFSKLVRFRRRTGWSNASGGGDFRIAALEQEKVAEKLLLRVRRKREV